MKCLAKDLEVNIAQEIILHDFFMHYKNKPWVNGKEKETKQKGKKKTYSTVDRQPDP